MRVHIPFISLAQLCIYLLVLWKIIIDQQHYLFIDHLNLIFHEAGHFAFFFFGSFLHTLGGTLMQLLIPVSISIYFYYYDKDWHGVLFGIFWTGQNVVSISYYISDAVKQQPPLLGNGRHDWHYLLSEMGLLNKSDSIGTLVYWIGIGILVGTVSIHVWKLMHILRQGPNKDTSPPATQSALSW